MDGLTLLVLIFVAIGLISWVISHFDNETEKEIDRDGNFEEEIISVGKGTYSFRYEPTGQSIDVIARHYPPISDPKISRCPSKTHVYSSGKVCTKRPIKTLHQAKAIARYWAAGYEVYRKTGSFPDSGGRVEV